MKTLALISKADNSVIKTMVVPDNAPLPELHQAKPFYWCVFEDTKPDHNSATQRIIRTDIAIDGRVATVEYEVVDKTQEQLDAEKSAREYRNEFNTAISNGDAISALKVLQKRGVI